MKLFIGCSSSNEIPNKYFGDCKKFLEELMKENDLVFGACHSGLMGLAYDVALEANREIVGICPVSFIEDFKSLKCSTEVVTNTVNERTDSVIAESDGIVFLPGGIGTIYELFTSIESKRCKEFDKPIVIYNSCGFFEELLSFMDKVYGEKFSKLKEKKNYFISDSITEILYYLNNYKLIKKIEERLDISFTDFVKEYNVINGSMKSFQDMDHALMNEFSLTLKK